MNENEKNEVIDSENEAGAISPTKTDSHATFNEIDTDIENGEGDLEQVNEENITLIKINDESINSDEVKEGEVKESGSKESGSKESELENETLLIPADREEQEVKTETSTLEEVNEEEGSFLNDNLPLLSVCAVAVALVTAFVIKKIKDKKNKQ